MWGGLRTHHCFQHLLGSRHPGLKVLLNRCLSSCPAFQNRQVADSSSLSQPPGAPESTAFFPFGIRSRGSALVLGVSRAPVFPLSIQQQQGGQFLSSLQVHVLILFLSAPEGTSGHSWRRGSTQILSSTLTPKFFPCYLSFSTLSTRTAPRCQPHLEPLCLPSPASAPPARTAPLCLLHPRLWPDPGSDTSLPGTAPAPCSQPAPPLGRMETPGVQEGVEASRELNRTRSRQGIARAPKHLWRQPRHPILIQRRFHSDPDKSVGRRERDLSPRPTLEKSLRAWSSSFHRR